MIRFFVSTQFPINQKKARKYSRSLLIEPSELEPTGWKYLGTWSWKAGVLKNSGDPLRRAGKNGCFTARSNFRRTSAEGAELSISLTPFRTPEEVRSVAPNGIEDFCRNPLRKFDEFEGRTAENMKIDGVDEGRNFEARFRRSGMLMEIRVATGIIENIGFSVVASGQGNGVSWKEVAKIANLQVAKLRTTLN